MKADLEQLEKMQEDLFRQQCDLDIQKAMVKHFIKKKEDELLTLTDVVKSLPTKEEINLAANECSDINEIICEDEYWVIAKNDGFKEGADFVINKLK
tara:strand:- start:7 stop:297 length:291 start_codon:yes stop_codon:yes gene_type:complete